MSNLVCTCEHGAQWHGDLGCGYLGWHYGDPKCGCRLNVDEAVAQIVARHVAAALEAVGTSVGSLLKSNPMNGDGSNYTLEQLLRRLDHQAGSAAPSRAAAVERKRREDAERAVQERLNANRTASPP